MNRDFRFFWTGQVTSSLGSACTAVALPLVAVRHLGASPGQTGVLVAASGLPLLLFGLLTGAWADRLPRKRPYLIGCDLTAAAAVGSLAVGLATGHLTVWLLAAFCFVLATLGLVIETVYFVHLRSVIGDVSITRARARLQAGEYTGGVLGRAIAGPAAALGVALPFLIDMVSYLASAVCLALIRRPEPAPTTEPAPQDSRPAATRGYQVRELAQGFTLLRREPFLRRLTPFLAVQQVVSGMILALLGPFLLTVLDVPTSWYGLLFVLTGVCGLVGSLASDRLGGTADPRRIAVLGYLGVAVTTTMLPAASGPVPVAATVAALAIGLPYLFGAIANVGVTSFLTAAVADNVLGRATVSVHLLLAGAYVAGSLLGGLLGGTAGIVPTLWLAATLSLTSIAILRPAMRLATVDRPAERPAPAADLEPTG